MPSFELTDDHPLYNPLSLFLRTSEIDRLSETLTQWLWTGQTGGFIKGKPRVGKSTALKMLSDELHTRTGKPIPSHVFTVPPRDKGTIQAIYRNLCISADIKLTSSRLRNTDALFEDFFHYLMDMALITKSKRVLLFVDEMQRLTVDQIEVFAELHDLAGERDVLLTVVFTGNDTQCDKLIERIKTRERELVHKRFFTQELSFTGLRSLKDVRDCLGQYDKLRFPTQTGPTYTQAVLPDEFASGFRLKSLSSIIWDVFREHQRALKLEAWAMKYFTTAISTLLVDYLPEFGVDNFCEETVERCIEVSGLIPSVVEEI